ncbi:DUF5324 family protein [Yinghuangia sp. ASG 101]|uniref:DUF5324 family protein n=1 Tax=Yinghuangia sp. ASG 101 TaxID=2896848 RepID=UPI001E4AA699|nr:DUF5324 family protein [Yinghuangia sp. ASG 101]UGQ15260.1 DUF5324 family protein [Yinghuangia sp. ASG 101]
MTRWDQARDARDRTLVLVVPHAAKARNAAVHHAADARDWAAPRLEYGMATARRRARDTTRERVVPAMENARFRLEAFGRDTVVPAIGPRAQHAMDSAKHRMRDDVVPRLNTAAASARESGEPMLHAARSRAEAAAMALRGDLSATEMSRMVARKRHRKRNSMMVLCTALAIGATLGWMWWQRKATRTEWRADESTAVPPTVAGPDAFRSSPNPEMTVTDPGHATEDESDMQTAASGRRGSRRSNQTGGGKRNRRNRQNRHHGHPGHRHPDEP